MRSGDGAPEGLPQLTNKGPLALLARYVTAAEIRKAGRKRLLGHVAKAGNVPHPVTIVELALAASAAQRIAVPGEALAEELCRELAAEALAARERIGGADRRLEEMLERHPDSARIQSHASANPPAAVRIPYVQ